MSPPSIYLTPDASLELCLPLSVKSSYLMEKAMAGILQTFVLVDNFTLCNPSEIKLQVVDTLQQQLNSLQN